MPAVPNVPGVPALRSYSLSTTVLLTADVLRLIGGPLITRWGLFRFGIPVLFPDNQISFEFKKDFSISDYPVEGGAFQNYNKVELPGDARCRFTAGGSILNRQVFLQSIEAIQGTTDLYDVVTPEKVFLGYNISHVDYARNAKNGVGLITADIWLVQIREDAVTQFTSTQQPGIAARQGAGNVPTQAPGDTLTGPTGGGFF